MNISETMQLLESAKARKLMVSLYGETNAEENIARYQKLVKGYQDNFSTQEIFLFTSPGRTEISGNHTDHNHGKVLAGSINLDCVGVAGKNGTKLVNIISETYNQRFSINLDDLAPSEKKAGTIDLVKGLIAGFKEKGYQVGGFDAYITSNVISAAGVSSSASFEMLLCSMLNTFFNDGKMDTVAYAHIGKYSENVYWDKASGLLDQMACAVGGLITIDFANPADPVVEKIEFDFGSQDHSLIIVQTGKGHADLSADYSSVPAEMKKVAEFFGKEVCSEITEEQVIDNLQKVREYAGDRSVLRALHFFEENKRVEAEVAALKQNDFQAFLENITASGNSSWKWLQNCYTNANYQEQGITVTLALTELFIAGKQRGACRVHGGGFAGVIMAMLPNDLVDEYIS
ncbi:MAG: galactokinase, partial [Lachnospiraceae bacterium]